MNNKRFTIGFLFDYVHEDYINKIFQNVIKCCRMFDLNFIGFGGGSLNSPYLSGKERNALYDLVSNKSVNGLISLSSSIGNYVDIVEMEKLFTKFKDLPIVNIGLAVNNNPTILVDNRSGMKDLVSHLINKHGLKKIAFIRGPKKLYDADQRYNAYKDTLKENNIKFDKKIIVDGDFDHLFGIKAVKILLDERKADFDAIVSSNDSMAISAVRELKKRGIRIPEDVIVTGFDDSKESILVNPNLTTVRQPFYQIAKKSVGCINKILSGDKVQGNIVLPTELVIRQSCGCSYERIIKDVLLIKKNYKTNLNNDVQIKLNDIYNKVLIDFPMIKEEENYISTIKELLSSLYDELYNNNVFFLKRLMENIDVLSYLELDAFFWYSIIEKIFYYFQIQFQIDDNDSNFEFLLKEALILIGILTESDNKLKTFEIENEMDVLLRLNEDFIHTYNLDVIKEKIKNELIRIGINSCYICLYDYKKNKNQKYTKLFFYLNNSKDKIYSKSSFLSVNLIPGGMNFDNRFDYIIMSLYFKNDLLGYILFEIGILKGTIYEVLTRNFSGAIHSGFLSDEIKKYTEKLETMVHDRTAELEEANKKLKDLDILKNDFIANITHDFRSPLMVILSLADLALKTSDKPDESFGTIYEASLKLKKTVDRLLELAKMDAVGIRLNIEKSNMIENLSQIIQYYNSSLSKTNIKIHTNFPEKEIENLYIDEEKFEEVINNILSNAIKFVNPNTGIIKLSIKDKKNSVLISIADNGIGMLKEKLGVIFERFEQIKGGRNSKYRGTGIGLAFAKQILDFLKGKIWAESDGQDKGSTFFIELLKGTEHYNNEVIDFENKDKLSKNIIKKEIQFEIDNIIEKDELKAFINDLNQENEYDYKKGKILIIDDDKHIRKIIMEYLLRYGYKNFILASNGVLGLDAIYKYHPDLIICDFNMEPLRGDEVHDEIALNPGFNKIPFIFISAVDDKDIIYDRKKKGASGYLTKPVDETELRLTVDNLLKKYIEYLKTYNLASIDELSGIYNRRSLMDGLHLLLAERMYRHISLIFFDIDFFKEFNDSYGHQFGDQIIVQIGKTLKSVLRNYDLVGRYGGDEFVVILPNTNLDQAYLVASQIQKSLKDCKIMHGQEMISIYISVGISSLIDGERFIIDSLSINDLKSLFEINNPEETNWDIINKYKTDIAKLLIRMADIALYKAKSTRCKSCGYSSEKSDFCKMKKCPKCGSTHLIKGRNKIVKFE